MGVRHFKATQVQRGADNIRDCAEGQDVPRKHRLGCADGGRGAPAQERRLAALQDSQGVRHESQAAHHRHSSAELFEGTLGSSALYHASQVSSYHFCYHSM